MLYGLSNSVGAATCVCHARLEAPCMHSPELPASGFVSYFCLHMTGVCHMQLWCMHVGAPLDLPLARCIDPCICHFDIGAVLLLVRLYSGTPAVPRDVA